ncbi:MAG: hypothetical protein ACOX3F_05935 [Kiritimatiellia bacterium]
MKKILGGCLVGMLALASAAFGVNVYKDSAANYGGVDDLNGANGGTGFEPWDIVVDGQGGWAGCGIWDSARAGLAMGEAFGYVGKVGFVEMNRSFGRALATGDIFELDFGVNWDSDTGNKGFSLFAGTTEVVKVNHGGYPGEVHVNGVVALANYGTNAMHWTFTQTAANEVQIDAAGRDGVETFTTTVSNAGALDRVQFYSRGLPNDAPDSRQSYANNLKLTLGGDPLVTNPQLIISGSKDLYFAQPAEYTVRRSGPVGDVVTLSSSATGVLTVPATATFANPTTNALTFNATPVSPGTATITVSGSGATNQIEVTYHGPELVISGPGALRAGETKTYTVTRNHELLVGDVVNLGSTVAGILAVPASVTFVSGNSATFQATGQAEGQTSITAGNDDAVATPLPVNVSGALNTNVIAYDEAGHYTAETFVNGANEGFGFGTWDMWNVPASLGDSTAGSGGDLNSTNGLSFRFMSDGTAEGWCNARRNFAGSLRVGDVVSFIFTYNWDGGSRGVDIFDSEGQFANLINVTGGNTFQVNGETISTEWSPGAVVTVEISQLADGIQVDLERAVGGVANLTYATNILNPRAATGFSMYCGGYVSSPADNVNYAIFMNDMKIVGTPSAASLSLSGPTQVWTDATPTYTLTRQGAVADVVTLTSSAPGVLAVPASVTFASGQNTVAFQATPGNAGDAVLSAFNADAVAAPLNVTVTVRPAYVAYDDASLYAGGEWSATPTHESGFSDWTVTMTPEIEPEGVYRGVFIGTSPIAAINVGGKAFGLYANWSGSEPEPKPEVKVSRSFPAALAVGQSFSVDVGYNHSGGSKGLKLKGEYEGVAYERFELFNSGNDTWSYKLDGNDETITVAWSNYIAGGFRGQVKVTCTAENTYTFSLQRDGEAAVVVADVWLPGAIDQVEFYNYNGGSGDEENFYFNRMGIEGASAPVGPVIDAITFDVATGNMSFDVPAGYTLVRVEGADCDVDENGAFPWQVLTENVHYTVDGGKVTLLTDAATRLMIRVRLNAN